VRYSQSNRLQDRDRVLGDNSPVWISSGSYPPTNRGTATQAAHTHISSRHKIPTHLRTLRPPPRRRLLSSCRESTKVTSWRQDNPSSLSRHRLVSLSTTVAAHTASIILDPYSREFFLPTPPVHHGVCKSSSPSVSPPPYSLPSSSPPSTSSCPSRRRRSLFPFRCTNGCATDSRIAPNGSCYDGP